MDYEALWYKLKERIESTRDFHKGGEMQSISESVIGEATCSTILGFMETLEKEVE